jgi:hypothetical protein
MDTGIIIGIIGLFLAIIGILLTIAFKLIGYINKRRKLLNLNSASNGEYVQPKFLLQIPYLLWNLSDHAMIL